MRLPNPYRDEVTVVRECLASLDGGIDWAAATHLARPWVQAVRQHPPHFWAMASLLKEYPLSGSEGLALMRLAEALLRVPDADTAIALTADQLSRASFGAHEESAAGGGSDAPLTRLSNTVIALSKKWLPDNGQAPDMLTKMGAKVVVAATVRAVQLLGQQFVLGENIEAALAVASKNHEQHQRTRYSFDMLGEGARTQADAVRYFNSYQHALQQITASSTQAHCTQRDGMSIKLSALHPRYEVAQRERVLRELVPMVLALCEQAATAHVNLTIDAEESDRLELSLDVFETVLGEVAKRHPTWEGFGLAMQAYQTRSLALVAHVIALARKYHMKLMCRLVKGAYWDAEIKRSQELGLPTYPVFTHKHHTDISYLACARTLLDAPDAIYPQFATHNAGTVAAIVQMADRVDAPFELQRLHGMGEDLYQEVLKNPRLNCRIYAPVGQHRDLLAYLVRRLLENGANASFVHQLADTSTSMDALLRSPLHVSPASSLPLPATLFGPHRTNSMGIDISVSTNVQTLMQVYADVTVPVVTNALLNEVNQAVQQAAHAQTDWNVMPVTDRADILRKAALALQHESPRFCSLLVKEAHKTWGDAVSEVREAIDFLRYYA